MSSGDNLQSLLAKYRAAPQIQAAVNTAIAQAKLSASNEGLVTGARVTGSPIKSVPFGPPTSSHQYSSSTQAVALPDKAEGLNSLQEVKGPFLIPGNAPSKPLPFKEDILNNYKNVQGVNENVENLLPSSLQAMKQATETNSKTVKIMETVEHYKSEPQRYLETHSVAIQTSQLLTEDSEVVQRLQGELNYMKTQLSCLQTEVIKQFLKIDSKLSILLSRQDE